MHYNVPQFIDIEDTIVGPLTAKQILWLFGMSGILVIMWLSIESKLVVFTVGMPVTLLFLAFAFYRPHGQPFIKFIAQVVLFLFKPKIYIWRREGEVKRMSSKNKKENQESRSNTDKKAIKQTEIIELAKILDSESDIIKNNQDKF